ncbi:class I SAM-dependent methyltransferase [Asticcacaulis tiandongensis]|uniref:class I SAM-dependent methyltransferase n=1 Tax=Asticcacaulis tiandongensis TaxID=2565365 RepID=UPI0011283312|nr:class I SAM-dependent methyltransferase [Asticcacaulis tiandongensis]
MLELTHIQGLKFPDEYVIRHFFKSGLQRRTGKVLEIGCGNGNNLMLYSAFGWHITGIDIDPEALSMARHNLGPDARLHNASADTNLSACLDGPYDVILLPNVVCYISDKGLKALCQQVRPHMASEAHVFLRTRLIDDYRYGRGEKTGENGFILDTPETGEKGLYHRFYTEAELLAIMHQSFGITAPVALRVNFDNHQNGEIIRHNSDLVLWGQT